MVNVKEKSYDALVEIPQSLWNLLSHTTLKQYLNGCLEVRGINFQYSRFIEQLELVVEF